MTTLTPYLNFNGNCAEAMAFYAPLLGGQAQTMTFAQMPPAEGAPPLSEADKAKVMHSTLVVNGQPLLFASDSLPAFCDGEGFKPAQGFHISINGAEYTLADAHRMYPKHGRLKARKPPLHKITDHIQ